MSYRNPPQNSCDNEGSTWIYLADRLDKRGRERVYRHISTCSTCQALTSAYLRFCCDETEEERAILIDLVYDQTAATAITLARSTNIEINGSPCDSVKLPFR